MRDDERVTDFLLDDARLDRVAQVRLVLTLATLAAIWLDPAVLSRRSTLVFIVVIAVGAAFCLHAATGWAMSRRPSTSVRRYQLASPMVDVVLASMLILTTGGHLDPFGLWFLFAIAGAGFSGHRRVALITFVLALAAYVSFSLIHQLQPMDISAFAVRTAFLIVLAVALLRIQVPGRLVESAMTAERTRLADELHDTYLQTLAAVDLRAEAARALAQEQAANGRVIEELTAIKRLVRQSAAWMRDLLDMSPDSPERGPAALRRILIERWHGEHDINIDPCLRLSESRWRTLEMLLMEGLNNVSKHALTATRVGLRLGRTESGRTRFSLRNNGSTIQEPVRFGYGLNRLAMLVARDHGQLRLETPAPGEAALIAEFEGGA